MHWKILNKELLAMKLKFKLWKIKLQYKKFDGNMSRECDWYFIEKNEAVSVVLFDPNTLSVLLVKQFRLISEFFKEDETTNNLLELVAGNLDASESPLQAAARECFEETGMKITKLKKIYNCYASPAIFGERMHMFYAEIDSSQIKLFANGLEHENEDVMPVVLNLSEAKTMLEEGKISDAKTIIGLQWLLNKQNLTNNN